MEERKQNDGQSAATADNDSQKIVFKQSTKFKQREHRQQEEDNAHEKKEVIRGNKFVMKEYVVGEKREKTDKKLINFGSKNSSSTKSAKQLRLTHLNEEIDEDDED